MIILHFSDLHFDVNERYTKEPLVDIFFEYLQGVQYDVLLLSGDITNSYRDTLDILDEIKNMTKKPVYFVPGNHDLVTHKGDWTGEVYQQYLNHSSNLIGKPVVLENGLALVGALGWYDYSYGNKDIPLAFYPSIKKEVWFDGGKINWKKSDLSVSHLSQETLKQDLESVKEHPIWVLTHFVPYQKFIVYKSELWNTCNAFMGSDKIGKLIDRYSSVQYVSFGHTHKRFGKRKHKKKTIICNPLGYLAEWEADNFLQEIEKIAVFIQV